MLSVDMCESKEQQFLYIYYLLAFSGRLLRISGKAKL